MSPLDEGTQREAVSVPASTREMRLRIVAALLAGVVHIGQLLLVASVVAPGNGATWVFAGAAGLMCLVTLLLVARSMLAANRALGLALLVVVVPGLASAAAMHPPTERSFVGYALGVTGSSLGLSFLGFVLALRASSRAVRLRLDTVGMLALAIGAGGALLIVPKLPAPAGLLLAGPVAWGLVVVALLAATLGGTYDNRDRDAGPRAAFDAVSAILLALGAVGLAALASGAIQVGYSATLDRAPRAWQEGVEIVRRAALSGLPILGAGAFVLGANAARLGLGVRDWGRESLLIAMVVVGMVAALRFELGRTSRIAAHAARHHPNEVVPRALPARPATPPRPVASPETSAQPPATPSGIAEMHFSAPTVKGGVFPSEVQRRLEALREKLTRCAARVPQGSLDHTFTLEFVVNKAGGVTFVAPDRKGDLPDPIETCLQMVLYHTGFPATKRGIARIYVPVHLVRQGDAAATK